VFFGDRAIFQEYNSTVALVIPFTCTPERTIAMAQKAQKAKKALKKTVTAARGVMRKTDLIVKAQRPRATYVAKFKPGKDL
jgi:uncharacterized membrane protein